MSSTKKLSPTLKKLLKDVGNVEAIKIAQVLLDAEGEKITDEKIAEDADIKLNIARKILYILNENDLTQFHRVRDKRSGWYVYYWNHNFDNLEEMLSERRDQVIDKLETRMKFEETNLFFKCNNCEEGNRFTFNDAMDFNFQCPVCNAGNLIEDPNKETVDYLKKTIVKLRSQQYT